MNFIVTDVSYFVVLATIVFSIGIFGIFANRRSIISVLMCIEVMLLAVNINFLAFSAATDSIHGHIISLLVLTVAAAEASIGLAIILCFYRLRRSISVDSATTMKG